MLAPQILKENFSFNPESLISKGAKTDFMPTETTISTETTGFTDHSQSSKEPKPSGLSGLVA